MRRRNRGGYGDYYGFPPYVPVGERRRRAEREMQKLKKKGRVISPVEIEGNTIAATFWGRSWCKNLESYSDFSNRLPRGRAYVRNGSVVDLQIAPGEVSALVSGSDIYKVAVKVSAIPKARWNSVCADCAGAIDSLVELLQGRFSKGVMERVCRQKTGLFPSPAEIEFSCSCPDWASMCKHVAAVLYGIGARLDEQPELLFKLRKVHEKDLIAKAGKNLPLSKKAPAVDRVLATEGLSELFGLEMGAVEEEATESARTAAKPAKARKKKPKQQKKAARKPGPKKKNKAPVTKQKAAKPAPSSKKKRSKRVHPV